MTSTPKAEINLTNGKNNNGSSGKRKKNRGSKGSYLCKWLDKTLHQIQDATPSMDTYASLYQSSNYGLNPQFGPGFDPCRFNGYGYPPEPMSLPTLPTYCNIPPLSALYPECRYVQNENKSVQVQRPRVRRRDRAEEIHSTPLATPNGTLKVNYLNTKNFIDSQDYSSLPPIVTSVGDTTSNSDMNTNEKDDGSHNRRYSDPGLPDVARAANGDLDSESEESSQGSESQIGGKVLACLLDQIRTLKITNERLNKDLQETKAELNIVKQQNSLWQKGSASSIGTPNHMPLNNNAMLGQGYSPGVVTDVVREIRDAARLREEAMFARVRAMLHDRTDNGLSMNDTKFSDRSLDDIKSTLRTSEADKRRLQERMNKLEAELKALKLSNGRSQGGLDNGSHTGNGHGGAAEEGDAEKARLRKELADARRAKQAAEEQSYKLEMLVTQLRSKFRIHSSPSGPESLAAESECETASSRVRRTSVNSSTNSTVVFGPVTDL